jgi:N-acetylglucosamine malate deacetylase 1
MSVHLSGKNMKLDILAFGVHPDDVELSCGGTLLKQASLGYKTGVIDLTLGELGTRGTPELRLQESENAAEILGLAIRDNLGMKDGFFTNDENHQMQVISQIRKYRPDIVLCNAINDRHPDHGRAAQLVADACFLSGLRKIETDLEGDNQLPWRPKVVYHYIQAYYIEPDFVVDISDFQQQKMQAVFAYKSQFFNPDSSEPDTFISSPEFLDFLKARNVDFGTIAGVKYAEGFTAHRPPAVHDLTQLF